MKTQPHRKDWTTAAGTRQILHGLRLDFKRIRFPYSIFHTTFNTQKYTLLEHFRSLLHSLLDERHRKVCLALVLITTVNRPSCPGCYLRRPQRPFLLRFRFLPAHTTQHAHHPFHPINARITLYIWGRVEKLQDRFKSLSRSASFEPVSR